MPRVGVECPCSLVYYKPQVRIISVGAIQAEGDPDVAPWNHPYRRRWRETCNIGTVITLARRRAITM